MTRSRLLPSFVLVSLYLVILNLHHHVHPEKYVSMGILHTVQEFTAWHINEEWLFTELSKRKQLLHFQRRLLRSSLHLIKKLYADGNSQCRKIGGKKVEKLATLHLPITTIVFKIQSQHYLMIWGIEESGTTILNINPVLEQENWFGVEDLFFSMMAWINFQDNYKHTPVKLFHSQEIDSNFGGKLSKSQSLIIGMFALMRKRYTMAVEWIEFSLTSPFPPVMFGSTTSEDLQWAYHFVAVQQLNKWQHDDTELTLQSTAEKQFVDLCQENGSPPTSSKQKSSNKLKCHYEHKRHPALYISPVKVEQLSESPPLYQFYEILSNATIATLKNQNSDYVELSGKKTGEWSNDIGTKCGFSAGIGFHPETPKSYLNMSEIVSGLRFLDCQLHGQYVEYTYGRMYPVHSDHSGNMPDLGNEYLEKYGDYLATMLYYLEVPIIGGTTPFISPGVVAYPERGSAILWFNMYLNGSVRNDVAHGSCPVVHGEKIITTHFFRYNNNWNVHKCSLNPYE